MVSPPLPKVCRLNNGNLVMVFYHQNKKDDKAELRARCYTSELKLLWEKDLFTTEQKFFSFDMASHKNGFVVAIPSLEGLKFHSLNEHGGKTGYTEYKRMVGTPGFHLMRVGGKTIAVWEKGGPGNIKELTIKARVIAFD